MRYSLTVALLLSSACGSSTPPPAQPAPSATVAAAPTSPAATPGATGSVAAASPPSSTATAPPPTPVPQCAPPAPTASSSATNSKLTPEQQKKLAEQAEAMQRQALTVVDGRLGVVDLIGDGPPCSVAQPSKPSRGEVQIGATTMQPSVPNGDRTIAALRPRFRACYNQGLDADPSMAGKVAITAKVGPNGDVASVMVSENMGLSIAVTACLSNVLKAGRFDAVGANGATVNVALTCVQSK